MKYKFTGDFAISADTLYEVLPETIRKSGECSFGFLTEENRAKNERLAIPELNSGYSENEQCTGYAFTRLRNTADGVTAYPVADSDWLIPVTFVADVPKEGNYLVKVTVKATETVKDGLIFTGRRRLALRKDFERGEIYTGNFAVNICPIIPRNHSEVMEDETLDVTIIGKGLVLSQIEVLPYEGPTMYIAGDSTLTDQNTVYPYHPALSYCGWGQMISCFVGDQMAVSNHAHSGLTTNSMRSEGHYGVLYDRIKPGDLCLFQFGHNDQKLMELKAEEGYANNLNTYIDEIQAKGATPVIVSPLARNTWKGDGTYNDLLVEYAAVCEKVARKRKVPYVDLHRMSLEMIVGHGREDARRYFFPSDYTHSNDYGAYLFAEYVYTELARNGVLESSVEMSTWEPPVELPVISLPKKEDIVKEEPTVLFAELDRKDDLLIRAEALQMVITTMKFFPTNVYNDMFDDVVGHETYAGSVECAYQNGIIPRSMVNGRKIEPEKVITGKEFLEVLKLGYLSRRPDAGIIEKLDLSGVDVEKAITREQAAVICRQIRI